MLGFTEFLEREPEFVNEIDGRFRSLGLSMVGKRSRAGAQELVGDMALGIVLVQRAGEGDNTCSKVEQAFL